MHVYECEDSIKDTYANMRILTTIQVLVDKEKAGLSLSGYVALVKTGSVHYEKQWDWLQVRTAYEKMRNYIAVKWYILPVSKGILNK